MVPSHAGFTLNMKLLQEEREGEGEGEGEGRTKERTNERKNEGTKEIKKERKKEKKDGLKKRRRIHIVCTVVEEGEGKGFP